MQGVATKEDWIMVLMGGRETTYAQDEAILQVGDRSEMIYQLSSGKCRINIGTKTVGSLTMDNVCRSTHESKSAKLLRVTTTQTLTGSWIRL